MTGNLIIISSPSGGGKGTLIKEVIRVLPEVAYSVSFTTRKIRRNETEGVDYFFIDPDEFKQLIQDGEFLEYAEVHGNFYGTSAKQIESEIGLGRDIILEIDVQGAKSVLEKVPEAVSVFILPPSFDTLRRRLMSRATEDQAAVGLRLKNSRFEVSQYESFEYIVVNSDIEEAAADICSIISSERLKRIRQTDAIQDILDSFDVT